MLAIIMLFDQRLLEPGGGGIDLFGHEGHPAQFLKDFRVVKRLRGGRPPRERPVPGDQRHRNLIRIQVFFAEAFDDLEAGFGLVIIGDAFVGHEFSTGNIRREVVGVGGAVQRHRTGRRAQPTA